jgi:hypothetical protein
MNKTLSGLHAEIDAKMRNSSGGKGGFVMDNHKFSLNKIIRGHQAYRAGYKWFFGREDEGRDIFDREGIVENKTYKYRELDNVTEGLVLTIHSYTKYTKKKDRLGCFAIITWNVKKDEDRELEERKITISPVVKIIQFDYLDDPVNRSLIPLPLSNKELEMNEQKRNPVENKEEEKGTPAPKQE